MNDSNSKKDREYLKGKFKDGLRPSEKDFHDWLDATLISESDQLYVEKGKIGIGKDKPLASLDISGLQNGQEISLACQGGKNSRFTVAHKSEDEVHIGAEQGDQLKIGFFSEQCREFTPSISLTRKGHANIGSKSRPHLLTVKGSVHVSNKITLGKTTLETKGEKLFMTVNGESFELLTTKSKPIGKPTFWILLTYGLFLIALILFQVIGYLK